MKVTPSFENTSPSLPTLVVILNTSMMIEKLSGFWSGGRPHSLVRASEKLPTDAHAQVGSWRSFDACLRLQFHDIMLYRDSLFCRILGVSWSIVNDRMIVSYDLAILISGIRLRSHGSAGLSFILVSVGEESRNRSVTFRFICDHRFCNSLSMTDCRHRCDAAIPVAWRPWFIVRSVNWQLGSRAWKKRCLIGAFVVRWVCSLIQCLKPVSDFCGVLCALLRVPCLVIATLFIFPRRHREVPVPPVSEKLEVWWKDEWDAWVAEVKDVLRLFKDGAPILGVNPLV